MSKIRVIDFETTGFDPPEAEVCEVGYCDLTNDGAGWIVGEPQNYLCAVTNMPPQVRAVHHITLAECADEEPFDSDYLWLGPDAHTVDCVSAHNSEFEARFWGVPNKPVICTYKTALRVWPDAPGHSNGVLRYWLEDEGKISLDHETAMPPHRAGPDAYVTAHILKALLTEATGAQMAAWTKEPRLLPTCPIGKEWKGKPWPQVDAGFLGWMLRQADMEADLKWNAQREIARRSEGTGS